MTKTVASYLEKRAMEECFLTNSTHDGNPNARTWNPGWNFERVAREAAPRLSKHHAMGLARLMEISIADPTAITPKGLGDRVARLESEVLALKESGAETARRLNKLIDEMGADA
jgi:hypothetical protein